MQVRPHQLHQDLRRHQPPLVMVFGDDSFLVEEALDVVRSHARDWGAEERLRLAVEAGFDWQQLWDEYHALSLFATRRLIELDLNTKLDDMGRSTLTELLANPNPDIILLLRGPRAEKSMTGAKWFKTLEQAGFYVPIYSLDERQFPGWLSRRLQQVGLNATPDALAMLATFTEGNLLAASQEVQKLALLHQGQLDRAMVEAAVLDHARFDLFQWTEALLGDDAAKALRVLARIREEGLEPPLLIWALDRELEQLLALLSAADPQAELARRRMPPQRKPLYQKALRKLSAGRLRQIQRHLAWLDQHFKLSDDGDVWPGLMDLTLAFFPGQRPRLDVIRPGYAS
ncbi:DNA polymerase III subunit delta [Gallaecimonas sp. GXIMD4217]|uniref:DNA polymerase III subunit delta n=1 Tax=Gallaecimonas sp. GXIMD4217 TaxID=3131927 RepID=UPI00311B227C